MPSSLPDPVLALSIANVQKLKNVDLDQLANLWNGKFYFDLICAVVSFIDIISLFLHYQSLQNAKSRSNQADD